MIQIKRDFAIELKNEIERLYFLTKKINTNGTPQISAINESESQNGIKYIQEVDRYERPYMYYHIQIGKYAAEIRKTKKGYAVVTHDFTPKKEQLKENTTERKQIYSNQIKHYYENEDFEETIENFKTATRNLIEYLEAKKDNLLIW